MPTTDDYGPVMRVESVHPLGGFPVRLTLPEKMQILGFLIVHTVVILAFAWKLSVSFEHRLTSIEISQEAMRQNMVDIKSDVRELRR